MFKMALEYVEPGMQLARDIYGDDGKIVLSTGATINKRQISILENWGICYIYVNNPLITLPPISEVVEETTRIQAANLMRDIFDKTQKSGLYQLTSEMSKIVNEVILGVLRNRLAIIHLAQIHRHHNDLFAHSVNVSILSTMTAVSLGISNSQDLSSIAVGSMLHDIGMIAVPPRIIAKRDSLRPEELELLEGHTVHGFEILRKVRGFPLLAAHIAFQHHERFDGLGYPRKISGEEIHLFARIVAVAEEYDNLVADRPDNKGLAPHVAYEKIVAGVNSLFDPNVTTGFLSKIALYPIGTMVKLTTGQIGVVSAVTARLQHRPRVEIITDPKGVLLYKPYSIDLSDKEHLTIFIEDILSDSAAAEFLNKNQ